MTDLIKKHSKEEHADSIDAYLPSGRLFEGGRVTDTNLRKLLLGLSGELVMAEGFLKTIETEYDITTTTLFIDEWEAAVGIPDDCFLGTGDIEERRKHVLVKLASLGIQTEADFENLAAILGITVDIIDGITAGTTFPLTFPSVLLGLTDEEARFTIVVTYTTTAVEQFPYTFPLTFVEDTVSILRCLFNKLKPANCNVLFQQV